VVRIIEQCSRSGLWGDEMLRTLNGLLAHQPLPFGLLKGGKTLPHLTAPIGEATQQCQFD
jgi:hypothetical protein